MDFKNSQARQGRAFRHLWQMKKICLLFGSAQPISLWTLSAPKDLRNLRIGLDKNCYALYFTSVFGPKNGGEVDNFDIFSDFLRWDT